MKHCFGGLSLAIFGKSSCFCRGMETVPCPWWARLERILARIDDVRHNNPITERLGGDIQVCLSVEYPDDLDLHVKTPCGVCRYICNHSRRLCGACICSVTPPTRSRLAFAGIPAPGFPVLWMAGRCLLS